MRNFVLAIIGLVLLIVVLAVGSSGLWMYLIQPVATEPTPPQQFVVPKGQAVSIIGQRLTEAGLIRHPLVFRLLVQQTGLGNQLQAGSFQLSANMSALQIARTLTMGAEDVWVTLLEGWRREEIAEALARSNLDNFDEASFLAQTTNLEGQLFPDTYLLPRTIGTQEVVDVLTSTFDRKITQGLAADFARSERSAEEILIMASLLEREAQGYEDMRHVAGVLWNRIDIGQALQVDATLQYAKGYDSATKSWWSPPLAADKDLDSPYNTYRYPGLPAGPIANPGLEAVRAALNPLATQDMFYIHDRTGQIHFAQTYDQHLRNINQYLR